jgi:hypothetical protein
MQEKPSQRPCRLASAVGRAEPCIGASCPFWEPGGAVLQGRCAFERVSLSRPELARFLLFVRSQLEAADTPDARRTAGRLFAQTLTQVRRE